MENYHFSHGFPFINHQTITVDEWEAQKNLTGTSEDNLGLLTIKHGTLILKSTIFGFYSTISEQMVTKKLGLPHYF